MIQNDIYYQPPGSGSRCSTPRSARLRERRFAIGYEQRETPPEYARHKRQHAFSWNTNRFIRHWRAQQRCAYVVDTAPSRRKKTPGCWAAKTPFSIT